MKNMEENIKLKKFIETVALLELTMDNLDYMIDNKLVKMKLKNTLNKANKELKEHLDLFYQFVDPNISQQIIDFTILLKKNMIIEFDLKN